MSLSAATAVQWHQVSKGFVTVPRPRRRPMFTAVRGLFHPCRARSRQGGKHLGSTLIS
mgnify:CR=1 FL=1